MLQLLIIINNYSDYKYYIIIPIIISKSNYLRFVFYITVNLFTVTN
jgi:hypothetical protein